MDIYAIAPIAVSAAAFFGFAQFKAIKQISNNEKLKDKNKNFWIATVIVLNVLGIILYAFAHREKSQDSMLKDLRLKKDPVNTVIFLVLATAYVLYAIGIASQNPEAGWMKALLIAVLGGFFFRHYSTYNHSGWIMKTIPVVQVLIVVAVNFLAHTSDYRMIIIITVAMLINDHPLRYPKGIMFAPLILFLASEGVRMYQGAGTFNLSVFAIHMFRNTLTYCLIVTTFLIAKRQQLLNSTLKYLMQELTEKTQRLEEARLQEERNRIAREIHDTLGHTLTGVIIQLEAAKGLVTADPDKTLEIIEKTQDNTRMGFSDVKRAIKALRPVVLEEDDLAGSLDMLFNSSERDYNLKVHQAVQLPEQVPSEVKTTVYRFFQEAITNSLRHGKADEINVKIEHEYGMLRLDCSDNGKGCDEIREGFGLGGIRERIRDLNGQVIFSSDSGSGFRAMVYIPLSESPDHDFFHVKS